MIFKHIPTLYSIEVTTAEIPATSFVQGKSSGASGYVVAAVTQVL